MLINNKKGQTTDTYNMDECQNIMLKWKKPDRRHCIFHLYKLYRIPFI